MSDLSEDLTSELPQTVPAYQVSVHGLDEGIARRLGELVSVVIDEVSRRLDLSTLDGVTVAVDYPTALAHLDRGRPEMRTLEPTRTDDVIGAAMTALVLRDNVVKSHIVLDAGIVAPLLDRKSPGFAQALYVLAHECGHVAHHAAFERALPGWQLRRVLSNLLEAVCWDVADACWSEFSASRASASFGFDPLAGYAETFLKRLEASGLEANAAILNYRVHGDHSRVALVVGATCGNLLKFGSYLHGELHGSGRTINAVPAVEAALEDHWVAPFFNQLGRALVAVDHATPLEAEAAFHSLGQIALDMMAEAGVELILAGPDEVYVNVPFSPETMPSACP